MDRRAFVVGGLAALAVPLGVHAQQAAKISRIGILTGLPPSDSLWVAFHEALRELGYVEGKNIVVRHQIYRIDDQEHIRTAAVELAGSGVDVIVAGGSNFQMLTMKNATTTIPIVMTGGVQVVETGLVKSLARPGTNVTGVTWDVSTEEVGKRLELFKELVPTMSRMDILWDPSQPGVAAYWPDVRSSAKALGVAVGAVPASDKQTLDSALSKMGQNRPSAVFVWTAPVFFVHQRPICEWAVRSSVPTLVLSRQYVESGCLMSYGPSVTGIYREAARYVDMILKGAKAAALPVSRPSKFELVINAGTARSLNLQIPRSLLLRADHVIE